MNQGNTNFIYCGYLKPLSLKATHYREKRTEDRITLDRKYLIEKNDQKD
jgi:hypothetical protein